MTLHIDVEQSPDVPETGDPRVPSRSRVVSRDLLDRWAVERPQKTFIKFDDNGEEWSYAEFREMVIRTALGLQRIGVAQGDHVLVWLPNSRVCSGWRHNSASGVRASCSALPARRHAATSA